MLDQRLNPTISLLLPALLQARGRRSGTSHPDPQQPRPTAGSGMQDGELSEGGMDELWMFGQLVGRASKAQTGYTSRSPLLLCPEVPAGNLHCSFKRAICKTSQICALLNACTQVSVLAAALSIGKKHSARLSQLRCVSKWLSSPAGLWLPTCRRNAVCHLLRADPTLPLSCCCLTNGNLGGTTQPLVVSGA